jgi:hypothetical protein
MEEIVLISAPVFLHLDNRAFPKKTLASSGTFGLNGRLRRTLSIVSHLTEYPGSDRHILSILLLLLPKFDRSLAILWANWKRGITKLSYFFPRL